MCVCVCVCVFYLVCKSEDIQKYLGIYNVFGNKHGDTSSNPGRSLLHFAKH